jgi:hypothetical protein
MGARIPRPARVAAVALVAIVGLSCARRMVFTGAPPAAGRPVRAARAAEAPVVVAGPRLNHEKHLAKGLECADCHFRGKEGEKPAEPVPMRYDACAECHDDEDKALPPEKRVRAVFFRPDGSPAWAKAVKGFDPEVRWAHAPHAALACADCHGDLGVVPRTSRRLFDMDGCMRCHAQKRKAPDACSTCHTTLRADAAPPSHGPLWRRQHGTVAQAGQDRCEICHADPQYCDRCHQRTPPASHDPSWRSNHGAAALARTERCEMCHVDPDRCVDCHQTTKPASHDALWRARHGPAALAAQHGLLGRCELCHLDPNFCERCHAIEPPRSHTNLFRTRTHGVEASLDRTKCAACHETDFCVRCHQDTPPKNHGALWATGPSLHCAQCHFPLSSQEGCRVCHFEEPDHDTAPDQPAWHVPGMNCRLCHTPAGNGAPPLKHIDNGTQCEFCHH